MAHIEKRQQQRSDGTSATVWRARYRGPDNRERSRTFAKRADAERWLATTEADKARGSWVDPALGKTTVAAFAEDWLTTKVDVSPRTLINIEGRLRNHVLPFFGGMALAAVRPTHVRAWVAGMTADGAAPSTVKATYLTAAQVFGQAVVDGHIARTPCQEIKLPSDRRTERAHFLTAGQVAELADAHQDGRYRAMVFAAAYTGLRAGELAALTVSRLDLLRGRIDVAESVAEVRGRLVVGPTKTGRRRSVAAPRFLCDMLGEHLARFPSSSGYVFTAAEGGPVRHRNYYQRHFRPAVADARAAGVDLPAALRFHDLRHTCAAFLIAAGRHMEEVKEQLGHSTIRVTSDRYGHLFPQAQDALRDALEATWAATPAAYPRPDASVVPILGTQKGAV